MAASDECSAGILAWAVTVSSPRCIVWYQTASTCFCPSMFCICSSTICTGFRCLIIINIELRYRMKQSIFDVSILSILIALVLIFFTPIRNLYVFQFS